jgi:biopolymer transport protein ExbD
VKFRRKQRVETGIDITPLIDVVFLMLIFFMVSTTFTREAHLQLTLPEAEATPVDEREQRLELLVAATGMFSLNGKTLVNSRIETVMAALREASSGDTTQPLTITADAKTPHELVVRAMDAAGRLGFSRLSITTRLPEEGG